MPRENAGQSGVVYGIHPVSELLDKRPGDVDRLYFLQGKHPGQLFRLLKECRRRRLAYQVVPEKRLIDLCPPNATHQGVVAVCAARPMATWESVRERATKGAGPGLLVIPASVQDPRNLGSMIRSCAGFGVDALLLEKGNTAPLTDTVAKSSAGMLEHVPVCRPRSLEAAVRELKDDGYLVIGADARGERHPSAIDLRGPVVLVMGGEHRGIPPYLRKLCDDLVCIPLDPRVESLNVSVATGVLLYECSRQRGIKQQ